TGLNRNGLLKSLNQDASWEGTVYVSPFHAHLTVNEPIALSNMTLATNQFDSGSVARLNAGDRIEIQGLVRRDNTNALFTLLALHDGIELPGHRQHFTVSGAWSHFLYVLRIQNPMDSVQILINSGKRDAASTGQQTAEFEDFSMPVIKESVARVAYNNPTGTPHRGGATFDVLTLDYQPEHATPSPFDYSSTD
ncbi:MAG TPA: hypothetical protein HPP77_06935, partial [Candidatus Hydrogenedentes bacterium]|nr:hypothetical protein [Candidatus Hydrogenedentota bacterium]